MPVVNPVTVVMYGNNSVVWQRAIVTNVEFVDVSANLGIKLLTAVVPPLDALKAPLVAFGASDRATCEVPDGGNVWVTLL